MRLNVTILIDLCRDYGERLRRVEQGTRRTTKVLVRLLQNGLDALAANDVEQHQRGRAFRAALQFGDVVDSEVEKAREDSLAHFCPLTHLPDFLTRQRSDRFRGRGKLE